MNKAEELANKFVNRHIEFINSQCVKEAFQEIYTEIDNRIEKASNDQYLSIDINLDSKPSDYRKESIKWDFNKLNIVLTWPPLRDTIIDKYKKDGFDVFLFNHNNCIEISWKNIAYNKLGIKDESCINNNHN